jgi:uncharacterized protein (DUF1697 family)
MDTYIALFRGINVGGKNILPMKELVTILETIGYESVQTYIQSGNVVFRSRNKVGTNGTNEISREILRKRGFEPKVLLLSAEQLREAIENNPFPTNDGKALHFFFLESQPDNPNIGQLDSLKIESEKFNLTRKVLYLYAPEGIGRSKFAAAVEKLVGVPVTARNWNTVCKLVSMVELDGFG